MAFTEQAWNKAQGYLKDKLELTPEKGYTRPIIETVGAQFALIDQMKTLQEGIRRLDEGRAEAEQAPGQADTPENRSLREAEKAFGPTFTPVEAIEYAKGRLEEEFKAVRAELVEPTAFAQSSLLDRARTRRIRDPRGMLVCPHWDNSVLRRLGRAYPQQKLPVARAS